MNKFQIGDIVKIIDPRSKQYNNIGKIINIVKTRSYSGPTFYHYHVKILKGKLKNSLYIGAACQLSFDLVEMICDR